MNAANSISQGIGTAAQGISGAIAHIGEFYQKKHAADGMASLARDLGVMDDTAYQNYKSMGADERIGAMTQLAPLVNIQQNAAFKNAMLGYKQDALDLKSAGGAGAKGMAYTYQPGQGWGATQALGMSSGSGGNDQ
jgi:hypothetical protein